MTICAAHQALDSSSQPPGLEKVAQRSESLQSQAPPLASNMTDPPPHPISLAQSTPRPGGEKLLAMLKAGGAKLREPSSLEQLCTTGLVIDMQPSHCVLGQFYEQFTNQSA